MKDLFKGFLFVFFISISSEILYAQLSKNHYIPPIASNGRSGNNAYPQSQFIYISTPSAIDVNYTVIPVGSSAASYITGVVSKSAYAEISVGSGDTNFAIQLGNGDAEAAAVLNDKGYVINADRPVYVSVRLRAGGAQAGALVSKGSAGLGKSFRSGSFDSQSPQSNNYLNFISVMATSDNTSVTFDQIERTVDLINYAEPAGAGTFSINETLDAFETYVLAVFPSNTAANEDGLIGILIESDKDIVVNTGSSNGSFWNGSGRDYGIDQIVGKEKVGTEYAFVKGGGNDQWENVLLVATEDNTEIRVNGSSTVHSTIDASDPNNRYVILEGNEYDATHETLFVTASEKVFAYQGIGSGTSEANQSMFFVPPLSCQSVGSVDNIPNIEYIGAATYTGFVTIITNSTATVTFSDQDNTDVDIESGSFSGGVNLVGGTRTVQGTTSVGETYKAYVLSGLNGDVSVTSTGELYCAYYNQSGVATSGGFYSGFISKPEVVLDRPDISGEFCLPNVELTVSSAALDKYDSWSWWFNGGSGFVDLAQDNNPFTPSDAGYYKVIAYANCGGVTSTYESDLIPVSICPPDFDGDGINDNIDLDIDNDGIYNDVESWGDGIFNLTDLLAPHFTVTGVATPISGIFTVSTTVNGSNAIATSSGGSINSTVVAGSSESNKIEFLFPINDANFEVILDPSVAHNIIDYEEFRVTALPSSKTFTLLNADNQILIDTDFDDIFESGVTSFTANEIRFKFNPSPSGATPFSFHGEHLNGISITHINNNVSSDSEVSLLVSLSHWPKDTDLDGAYNSYDLDSDADSCFDTSEAGFLDTDIDGILGTSSVTVNSLGVVTSEGVAYTTPPDGDSNSVYDFLQSGSTVIITSLPTTQTICLGDTATYEVATDTANAVYKWQIYNGTDWEDINDDSVYSNTDSSTLSVTPSDYSLNGSEYRVATWKNNHACKTFSFPPAGLVMLPERTITISPSGVDLSDKWTVGEPNGGGGENHGEFSGSLGTFNDLGENQIRAHILELSSSIAAPAGYTLAGTFGGSSYYKSSTTSNFASAKLACENEGGSLLIINSIEEYNYIYSIRVAVSSGWFGLFQDLSAPDYSEGNSSETGGWYWLDCTPLNNSGNNVSLSETDSPSTFSIVLDSEPGSTVVLDISNPDITEAVISPTSVEFSTTNWNVPQEITVSPQQDFIIDGDQCIYPEITVNVSSTANCYQYTGMRSIPVTIIDTDVAGFEILPVDNLTDENGDEGRFTIRLLTIPSGIVHIVLSSSDLTEGSVQSSVTFSPSDWNAPKTIVVTGLPDTPFPFSDGNIDYKIITGNVSSTDAAYNALDGSTVDDVDMTNQDNNAPGIVLSVVASLTSTSEYGDQMVVQFELLSKPLGGANVTFPIQISGDTDEVGLSTDTIFIDDDDWNIPENNRVTITGLDDEILDGDIFLVLETGDPTSADPSYDGLEDFDIADLVFKNTDNDQAGFSLGPISNNLSEPDNSANFSVVLDIEPNVDVYLDITGGDTTEATVDSSSIRLTFTPLNWDIPQSVIINSEDDLLIDGDQWSVITVSVDPSSDPYFVDEPSQEVNVITMDDDVAGISLVATDNLTSEDGDEGYITVTLTTPPSQDVTISFVSNNEEEGFTDETIVFSSTNWDIPQIIRIDGVDDSIPMTDGAIEYLVSITSIVTDDPNYQVLLPSEIASISMTNQDNDNPGIFVSLADNDFTTSESGESVKIRFNLLSKPSGNASVSMPLSLEIPYAFAMPEEPQDTTITATASRAKYNSRSSRSADTEMDLTDTSISIENENWDKPEMNEIIIDGVDDFVIDGDQIRIFVTGDPSSGDPVYDNLDESNVADVQLINLDNDSQGIWIFSPLGTGSSSTNNSLIYSDPQVLSEDGTTCEINLKLSAEPQSEVILYLTLTDFSEVSVNLVQLIFNPSNWDTEQQVILTGVDDLLFDGPISSQLLISVDPNTNEPNFKSFETVRIDLVTLDNDVDNDNDNTHISLDNCPTTPNPDQLDFDNDAIGDLCDEDIDGDGVLNITEANDGTNPRNSCDFIGTSITLPVTVDQDCDNDGVKNSDDLDDDNDGILDIEEGEGDLDQDGFPNRIDADSDGDNCSDVVEAGFSDPNGDGFLGSNPVIVDNNGLVISAAGYATPIDNDNSGVLDYLEDLIQIQIITQPEELVKVAPDEMIEIKIETSPQQDIEIKWQISKDFGNSWSDLQESSDFQGVISYNLKIYNSRDEWVGWKFRASLRDTSMVCSEEIFSDESSLDYQELFIPNAFSPDNDGINDFWFIKGLSKFPNNRVIIYSRWEMKVLDQGPYLNDWNGEQKAGNNLGSDANLPEGTYFYILDLGDGQAARKGFIYLRRRQ